MTSASWQSEFSGNLCPPPYNKKDTHIPTEDITQHKRHLREPHSHTSEGGGAGAHPWRRWNNVRENFTPSPKDCDPGLHVASEREGKESVHLFRGTSKIHKVPHSLGESSY